MLGIFGVKLPRVATLLLAGAILVAVCAIGILYVWSPKATLRITTGPAGGIAERFISAFIGVTTAAHPQIRFETVTVADLRAASFAAGSMGPKVEAACRFVQGTGKQASIGTFDDATGLLEGTVGTTVLP